MEDHANGQLEKVCDENNLFCMEARILQSFVNTEEEEEEASDTGPPSRENDDNAAASTTRKEQQPHKEPPASSSMLVLRKLYERPYHQYGNAVESLLNEWLQSEALQTEYDKVFYAHGGGGGGPRGGYDEDEEETDAILDGYVTAEWMQQLGLRHRNEADAIYRRLEAIKATVLGVGIDEATKEEEEGNLQQQVDWSARAFQQALQYYEGLQKPIVRDKDKTNNSVKDNWFVILKELHVAIGYFNVAEVLALSPGSKQAALSKDYYIQSNQLFSQSKRQLMEPPPTSRQALNSGFPLIYDDNDGRRRRRRDGGMSEDLNSLWKDSRLAWGQVCLRLGVMEVSASTMELNLLENNIDGTTTAIHGGMFDLQSLAASLLQGLNLELDLQGGAGGVGEEVQKTMGDTLRKILPKFLASNDRAEAYFLHATKLFRQLLSEEDQEHDNSVDHDDISDSIGQKEKFTIQLHLGTALQNLGTTSLSKGDSVTSTQYFEKALEVQQLAIDEQLQLQNQYDDVDEPLDQADAIKGVGDILYSLAQSYLEQGDYEKAHETYNRAMDWFIGYDLPPIDAELSATIVDASGGGTGSAAANLEDAYAQSIQEFERLLEEYQELFAAGGAGVNRDLDSDGLYYEMDDGYEADLHAGLATLYMTTGDLTEATVHMSQALQLYTNKGEGGERHVADLKLNQAMLFFRQGQYKESAEAHRDTMEIYQKQQQGEGGGSGGTTSDGILDLASLTQSIVEEVQRETNREREQQAQQQQDSTTTTTSPHDENSDKTAEVDVSSDGSVVDGDSERKVHMNIRPLIVPEQLSNDTVIEEVLEVA